jgi:type I restriction enzyme, S subunit
MSSKSKATIATEVVKPALVPKLRFPEFRGATEWENAPLGVLSEVVRGGSPRPIDGFLTTAIDGLNWLKIGDVDKEAKYVTHTAEKVRREALSKTRVVNPGDLILSNSMSFGRPYILQINTCIHDGWIAITNITKNADRDFLYYLISAPSSQSYFVDNAAGSGVQNLNADIIKALPVCIPSPSEQQKISDCLSSVDELVAAQARKVDALKIHKKGLMQQLFPREDETQPRLRFPEFRNTGSWEPKSIGGVARLRNGYAFKSAEYSADGPYQIITIANVQQGNLTLESTKRMEALPPDIQKHQVLDLEDILISMTGNVGRVCVATAKNLLLNQRVGKLVPETIEAAFFYQLLQRDEFRSAMQLKAAGGAQGNLSAGDITEYVFSAPNDPAEQQRIASFLSSLDSLITTETQKLETLKTHKKGLMQQLFPSPKEVEA